MRRRVVVLAVGALLLTAAGAGVAIDRGGLAAPQATTVEPPSLSPGPTASANQTNGTLEVHYVNVGQADATLVVGPMNETMLIDSGDWRDDGRHVLDYLQRQNVSRIDYLVTTHAHADHVGGHAAVIEYYETEADGVGAIYDPGIASSTATYDDYLDAVERHDVTLYEARAGDAIPLDAAGVEILAPPRPYLAADDLDENSIALDVTYGNTSFLFTGDAGDAGESHLVDAYGERLNATVLQAGHHGSDTSTTAPFLDAVQPSVVVISSAYDSRYGHPHESVLQRLGAGERATYWTATHGDVVLGSDGENVTVRTQQRAPTNATELRSGDPIAPANTTAVTERARLNGTARQPTPTTPAVTDGGTTQSPESATGGRLVVSEIHADAQGDDWDYLNDEYVVFENAGDDPLDLAGWTVSDEADHTYTFPEGVTLGPGESLTLYTGSGTDSASERYWGSNSPVWNNGGDTIFVTDDDGELVTEEAYE